MTNKDKLLCLFESEGIDISVYKAQKENYINDVSRNEYLKQNDSDVDEVFKNESNTYEELCHVEKTIKRVEKKVYEKYPTNPFIYNYKNSYLSNLRICDCNQTIEGSSSSIEEISNRNYINKEEIYSEIKENWYEENKDYINKRKQIALEYVKDEYYDKNKRLYSTKDSNTITRIFNIILFVLLLLAFFGSLRPFIEQYHIYPTQNESIVILILFGVYTLTDISMRIADRNRIINAVKNRYNRILTSNDQMYKKLSNKFILSKNKLSSVENYRKRADIIDKEYLSIKRTAPFVRTYTVLKVIYDLTFLGLFIYGWITVGFVPIVIFACAVGLIKGISK